VVLYDALEPNSLLTPLESAYIDAACVARVREDTSAENSIALWVVGDVLRRGAAINAVEIAENCRRDP
jgi:aspartate-semialdehyde dehydrogenase